MENPKVAKIICNQDVFDVVLDGKSSRCLMNGIHVLSSKDPESFPSVVGLVVLSSSRVPNTNLSVSCDPSYSGFLKGLLDTVSKSDQIKIKVLEEKPDEIADQKPKQASLSEDGMENLKGVMKTACECFNSVLTLSEVLLKTKLPKTILSFKHPGISLTKNKVTINDLSKSIESYDLSAERLGLNLGKVALAKKSNMKDFNVRKAMQGAVDFITADFLNAKKLMASLVLSHYPLYNINSTFKKYTDYPATWFFDPSVYYNFTERYKDASDNLIDITRAEASTIRPLYSWFQSSFISEERY